MLREYSSPFCLFFFFRDVSIAAAVANCWLKVSWNSSRYRTNAHASRLPPLRTLWSPENSFISLPRFSRPACGINLSDITSTFWCIAAGCIENDSRTCVKWLCHLQRVVFVSSVCGYFSMWSYETTYWGEVGWDPLIVQVRWPALNSELSANQRNEGFE